MSLINFRTIYEKLFSSFDVAADTKMVEELEKDWVEKLMIIKRSWIFWLFISWMFIVVFALMLINSYLIFLEFNDKTSAYIIIWILWFNILYWIYSVISYFRKFRRIYWVRHMVISVWELKDELVEWDIAFTKFFNQTIFNYWILIWTAIYIVYYIIFVKWFSDFWIYWLLSIVFMFLQIFMSSKFKKRMCDLEMDFSIIVPGRIIFYNQSWILRNLVTINSDKIKTITSKVGNFLGSIFNYWDIVILTEWDTANMWEMRLNFISQPSETVHDINELLGNSEVQKDNNESGKLI